MKEKIDAMTQEEMAWEWRFGLEGFGSMLNGQAGIYFQDRFTELGGMTPAISKKIGWDR